MERPGFLPNRYLDACDLLGLPIGANSQAIESAFRRSSRTVHPDKNTSDDARIRFEKMTDAKELLLNVDTDEMESAAMVHAKRVKRIAEWESRTNQVYRRVGSSVSMPQIHLGLGVSIPQIHSSGQDLSQIGKAFIRPTAQARYTNVASSDDEIPQTNQSTAEKYDKNNQRQSHQQIR